MSNGDGLCRRTILIGGAASATVLSATSSAQTQADLAPMQIGFLVDRESAVIDYAGPWEVFQRLVDSNDQPRCRLSVLSVEDTPVRTGGGLQIVPDYSLRNAPLCKIVVVGAQGRQSDEAFAQKVAWLRNLDPATTLILSVCTGALTVAATGLLNGLRATTHPIAYERFEQSYPNVHLVRGARFVDNGRIVCSGGESAGIDAALYLGRRLFGREVAQTAATFMQYESRR